MTLIKRRLRPDPTAGFTLVQLAVVAAILMLVSAISFPSLVRSYEQQKLRQAALELQTMLQLGRTLAQRLQGNCGISFGNDTSVGVLARATPAASFDGTNLCLDSNLSQLRLTQITSVRDLNLSRAVINPAGSSATSSCSSSTACAVTFNSLGVLAGNRQIIYLSGSRTSSQYCINLNLTLIRVGFRNSSSGACTYSRT